MILLRNLQREGHNFFSKSPSQHSNIVIIKLADDMPRTKKNRQNIVETFCYLKVRLYNHEVHDFSILYETVFFACYTSQICTATGYQFSESPFCLPIYQII